MNRWIHRTPEPTGRGAVARSPRRTRLPICMPMSRRANTVKAAPICGGRACTRRCSATGASNATPGCWRANGPARRLAGSPPNRPRSRGSPANSLAQTSGCTPPRPPWTSWEKHTLSWSHCPRERTPTSSARSADRDVRNADRTWCIHKAGSHIDRAGPLDRHSAAQRRHGAHARSLHRVCGRTGNKLTDAERRRVVEVLTSDRFVDLAPLQIYAQLLDEGVYLCSVSTMYRVLGQHTLVAERRRLARHPSQVCPELVATAPQQVYSWDITKLAGPVKGTYFDAYVMIDIYSRYLVGVHVHAHESGVLARQLMEIFTHWYNHEHRHTGIGLHTPADVHFGLATDKAADRRTVLTQARARHPHRFGTVGTPKILDLPDTAWINRPAQNTTQETATTAA